MKKFSLPPYLWAVAYGVALTALSVFVILMTFVIPHGTVAVEDDTGFHFETQTAAPSPDTEGAPLSPQESESALLPETETPVVITADSYTDANIQIHISTQRAYNTTLHIVDIQLASAAYLHTVLAKDTYGRNITEKPSSMAARTNAILAINGDYYGAREAGFVVRNGRIYRRSARDATSDALAILADGSFQILKEGETSSSELSQLHAWQVFCFGPALLSDGNIMVDPNTEVDVASQSNPRTAIGMIAPLHYIIVVSDGRTSTDKGLSLYQLAQVMQENGCAIAYNFDGGGSSTLWFNGKIINNPSDKSGERAVSDCVTIGY